MLSQRYFSFSFFLSRCFPLTSFHLAISDVYFACVFILQRNVCEFDVLWWLGLIATCHFLPFRQISFAIVFWCHKFHSLSIPRTVFHCVLLSAVVKFCPFSSFSFIQYDSVMVTTLSSYQNMQSVHERHNVFFAAHILFSIWSFFEFAFKRFKKWKKETWVENRTNWIKCKVKFGADRLISTTEKPVSFECRYTFFSLSLSLSLRVCLFTCLFTWFYFGIHVYYKWMCFWYLKESHT